MSKTIAAILLAVTITGGLASTVSAHPYRYYHHHYYQHHWRNWHRHCGWHHGRRWCR